MAVIYPITDSGASTSCAHGPSCVPLDELAAIDTALDEALIDLERADRVEAVEHDPETLAIVAANPDYWDCVRALKERDRRRTEIVMREHLATRTSPPTPMSMQMIESLWSWRRRAWRQERREAQLRRVRRMGWTWDPYKDELKIARGVAYRERVERAKLADRIAIRKRDRDVLAGDGAEETLKRQASARWSKNYRDRRKPVLAKLVEPTAADIARDAAALDAWLARDGAMQRGYRARAIEIAGDRTAFVTAEMTLGRVPTPGQFRTFLGEPELPLQNAKNRLARLRKLSAEVWPRD